MDPFWTSRFLTLPSATVAVLDARPGGAPAGTALLVPGYTGSKEDFALILDPLATAGYRVLAIDQPGQYQSPGPAERSAYTVGWLGGVVDEVAAALGGPVHLLGHSFGGLVARAAVLGRPAGYRSLTLLCSGPAGMGDGPRRERMARLEPVAAQGDMAALYAAMEQDPAVPDQPPPPEPLREFLRTRFLASSLPGLFGMADALRSEPDRVGELRAVGVPTMVCFGEHDDAWPLDAQREMATRLGARLEVIAGAGHSPAMERPGPTAQALIGFWAGRSGS
ncbi:MAG TPA: alpha/beta hydrolase [Rugosimonospora sp.]|nr:alpha/beta hydrolase [Rugosimonospora sp.]